MRGAPAVDRISILPDHLKNDILSRLDTKDAVQTSVLSKKWRHQWIWLACLSFNKRNLPFEFLEKEAIVAEPRMEQEIFRKKEAFLNFVDQVLLHRSTKGLFFILEKLSVHAPYSGVEITSHVDLWLACAIKCGVSKLHLSVSVDEDDLVYQLPESFFHHACFLTRLKLTQCILLSEDPCKIRLCNLQELSLKKVHVDGQTINGIIKCGVIRKVKINNCGGFDKLEVSGAPKLEKVKIVMDTLKSVVIDAVNLRSFSFERGYSPREVNVNVATCKSIKHLKLHGISITDDQLSFHLSKLQYLEDLWLISCDSLENVTITAPNLKNLFVNYCCPLLKAEIDAPNLESFMLCTDILSLSLKQPTPRLTRVIISFRCIIYSNFFWYYVFLNLTTNFNYSTTTLSLIDIPTMYLYLPKGVRSVYRSPLWKVEHVELPVKSPAEYCYHALVKIIDSALWMSPHPYSITLLMYSTVVMKFHFQYKELTDREAKVGYRCCNSVPIQCWRHCLKEVKIDGLHCSIAAAELKALFESSPALERIEGLPL